MNYKVVETIESPQLEKAVIELLAQGWELQGGVSVSLAVRPNSDYECGDLDARYCQAMIKR
jgi:hypothetical protein